MTYKPEEISAMLTDILTAYNFLQGGQSLYNSQRNTERLAIIEHKLDFIIDKLKSEDKE
jgi:hypothetical protein